MSDPVFEVEAPKRFSESLIWQLNRDYYARQGIDAWRDGTVPHHLTSNSLVGRTYAELIFAFLQDLADQGRSAERVYILELGAGHGRLAFHILVHLERLLEPVAEKLPPYCYVLSDIGQSNLDFFLAHPQFRSYFEAGTLDVAYFDAESGRDLQLLHGGTHIGKGSLEQPLLVIANYFFDSIPKDLFFLRHEGLSSCILGLNSTRDPEQLTAEDLLDNLQLQFSLEPVEGDFYQDAELDRLLGTYRKALLNTYLFFPHRGIDCLRRLRQLSRDGLCLLSMDKGFHELYELEGKGEPEMITHGSFSFWVNYHALGAYCRGAGGAVLFPTDSAGHTALGCLFFLPESGQYLSVRAAYQRGVNDFGPDDFNELKKLTYQQLDRMNLAETIAMLRLSAYDSVFFVNILARLKHLSGRVTFQERKRIGQALHEVWNVYFKLEESFDLAYEIGGIFYDLGFYADALVYFHRSLDLFGSKPDVWYNVILCYYQLREDDQFAATLEEARAAFPGFPHFDALDDLDLDA